MAVKKCKRCGSVIVRTKGKDITIEGCGYVEYDVDGNVLVKGVLCRRCGYMEVIG